MMLFGATQATNYDSFKASDEPVFGATSYPAALDTLTNPNPTDSVATVSHSAQHANANDAIEALQAKLGISASTAVSNSILVGNGSGSSIWSTYATTTSLSSSLVSSITASTTNLIAYGSSTLQNFTAMNSTTTNATSTSLAVSNITTAIPYGDTSGSFKEVTIGSGLDFTSGTLSAVSSAVTASSTQFASGVTVATTTGMTAGQTAVVIVTFCTQNTVDAGLYAKQATAATTTLSNTIQNTSGGNVAHTINGSFVATETGNVDIYVGSNINSKYTTACGPSTFTIIKI